MIASRWTTAVPYRPCTTCKPSPDGSPAGYWALIVVCGVIILVALGLLIAESKAREDEQSDRPKFMIRAVCTAAVWAVIGLFFAGIKISIINGHKSELHKAAAEFALLAVQAPENCRDPLYSLSQQSGTSCDSSPRSYAFHLSESTTAGYGVGITVKILFAPAFSTNGEITFEDTFNKRSVCLTLPDTDVLAAAHPGATTSGSTDTIDVDSYISSDACPDAPVTPY